MDLTETYGDVSSFQRGPFRIYFVSNPELIRDILVTNSVSFKKSRALQVAKVLLGNGLLTNEGESHRRRRKLMQPVFHRKRIAGFADMMVSRAIAASERIEPGKYRDMVATMMPLSLSIVAKALFDAEVDDEADEIGKALTDVLSLYSRITSPYSLLLTLLTLPVNWRLLGAKRRLDRTIYRLIEEHRASGKDSDTLLGMLLGATDEETGDKLSDSEVRDEAITLLLAGHETMALALSWTWYLLSQHPEQEARLHAELDEVLGGRAPTLDDVTNLRYTRMVLAESMRLYPPAPMVGRRVIKTYQLGPYSLEPGVIVWTSPYVTHRRPEHWPEPEKFEPERFTPEQEAGRHKFAYFPFGGGPRVCIGDQFAWMEGILLIAAIAQQWKFRLAPGHPIGLDPRVTLRPRFGLRMQAIPR